MNESSLFFMNHKAILCIHIIITLFSIRIQRVEQFYVVVYENTLML